MYWNKQKKKMKLKIEFEKLVWKHFWVDLSFTIKWMFRKCFYVVTIFIQNHWRSLLTVKWVFFAENNLTKIFRFFKTNMKGFISQFFLSFLYLSFFGCSQFTKLQDAMLTIYLEEKDKLFRFLHVDKNP